MSHNHPLADRARAQLERDGSGLITLGDQQVKIVAASIEEARMRARDVVSNHARLAGTDVFFTSADPAGTFDMVVSPDGSIHDAGTYQPQSSAGETVAAKRSAPTPAPAWNDTPPSATRAQAAPEPFPGSATPEPAAPAEAPARPGPQRSFLTNTSVEEPARQGVRGFLNRLGFRLAPGTEERSEREDVAIVSQHWPGPRTVAVVNLKGGSTKTPTVCEICAVFALHGGGPVVAHECNQTRGTMRWRTSQGAHERTARDLLVNSEQLLSTSSHSADMNHYVHHQSGDKYDVLWADPVRLGSPNEVDSPRLGPSDLDQIHQVLTRYYRLIVIDTGNDESDAFWARAVELADQLVVVTTCQEDRAEAARELIEETLPLAGGRFAELAEQAVVIVSQSSPTGGTKQAEALAQRFTRDNGGHAREAVAIPFDPAMVSGQLTHASLRSQTKRAWLRASAAIARGF